MSSVHRQQETTRFVRLRYACAVVLTIAVMIAVAALIRWVPVPIF